MSENQNATPPHGATPAPSGGRLIPYPLDAVAPIVAVAVAGLAVVPLVAAERFAGAGYGDLKKEVETAYLAFADPFRARVQELLADPDHLDAVLAEGARAARAQAAVRLAQVYDRIGFLPAPVVVERTVDPQR